MTKTATAAAEASNAEEAYKDPAVLRDLYHGEGLSTRGIGDWTFDDRLGCRVMEVDDE